MSTHSILTADAMSTLSMRILALLGSGKRSDDLIAEIVLLVHKATGIESIGLRLADGLDFPYYFTKGFDQQFIEKEMNLCAHDQIGELIRDTAGNPVIECMCGNVICGRTNPSLPFFTVGGSFWSNCTTDLLATATEKELQSRTRNRCNGEGYESVALCPIKTDGKCHGLLQLNDRRKGMFKLEQITFLEGVAVNIGLLFLMRRMTDDLASRVADVTRAANVRGELLVRLAKELRNNSCGKLSSEREDNILNKIELLLAEVETLKGIVPIGTDFFGRRLGGVTWFTVRSQQTTC